MKSHSASYSKIRKADVKSEVFDFNKGKYGNYQCGITDPRRPIETPKGVSDKEWAPFRGQIDKQGFMTLVRADVLATTVEELEQTLKALSNFARDSMAKRPSTNHLNPLMYGRVPSSYRTTVTIAYGASLFVHPDGQDRFGLCGMKPKDLKAMPPLEGDADDFDPHQQSSDIIVVIASDHPYVNVAVARSIAHYQKGLNVLNIEQGFGRPDEREFLRFDDGIDNLRAYPVGENDMERLVYVGEGEGEPDWCVGGSYLVYRKIQERLPIWEAFSVPQQEGMIGREKESGKPLSRKTDKKMPMQPVYPNHKDPKDGPLNAHIRKVQPRRKKPDLFGINDLDRRFLRRPYPFFDPLDDEGNVNCGLQFVAYMKSIRRQFEHVTTMWQMNPDFPVQGTGIDALYAREVLSTIDGGYYFCPPAPKSKNDFIGSALFK